MGSIHVLDLKNANSNGNFKHAISWALPHVNYLKKNKKIDLGHLYSWISCTVFSARNFYRISHILKWIILSLARTTRTTTPSNKNGSNCVFIQSSIDKLWQKNWILPNVCCGCLCFLFTEKFISFSLVKFFFLVLL